MKLFFYISTFEKHNYLLNVVFRARLLQTPKNDEYKITLRSQNIRKGLKWNYNTDMLIKWPIHLQGGFTFESLIILMVIFSSVECWADVLSPSFGTGRNYSINSPVSVTVAVEELLTDRCVWARRCFTQVDGCDDPFHRNTTMFYYQCF